MTQFTDQNLVARNLPLRFQGGADNEGHGMTNVLLPLFSMLFEYGEGAWLVAAKAAFETCTTVKRKSLAGSGLSAFNRWEAQSRHWHSFRLPPIAGVGERLRQRRARGANRTPPALATWSATKRVAPFSFRPVMVSRRLKPDAL